MQGRNRRALLCICNFGTMYLLIRLLISSQKSQLSLQREKEVFCRQQSYWKRWRQMVRGNEEKLKRLKKELLEELESLLQMMETGETLRVMEILQRKQERVTEVSSFVNTRSMVANAAMNQCFSRAARHHIQIVSMVPEEFAGIEEYDLSSLLTNMLDNAIEGCLQVPEGAGRSMQLKITTESRMETGKDKGHEAGQIYIFQTENTAAGKIRRNNPFLATTKAEKENHGYGTGIIREIARKYHGNAAFFEREDAFCCRVVLFTDGYRVK